jgi:hypothetical protein
MRRQHQLILKTPPKKATRTLVVLVAFYMRSYFLSVNLFTMQPVQACSYRRTITAAGKNAFPACLHGLKLYFFNQLFSVFGLHKNRSTVITGFCLKRADAELVAAIISFMFYFEIAHAIVGKKIL